MQKQNSQQEQKYTVVDTFPQYFSRNVNFRVELLNEMLKTPAYSVYTSLFNGITYTTNLEICSVVPEGHLEKPETVVRNTHLVIIMCLQ